MSLRFISEAVGREGELHVFHGWGDQIEGKSLCHANHYQNQFFNGIQRKKKEDSRST